MGRRRRFLRLRLVTDAQDSLYLRLADRLTDDIRSGAIAAGTRLPTQRDFAAEVGTTVGTVGRAYTLLHERGLVSGAVGRGTFVLPPEAAGAPTAPSKPQLLKKLGDLEAEIAELRAMIEKL